MKRLVALSGTGLLLALSALLIFGLDGIVKLAESPERPWLGYAWNPRAARYEFWFTSFETHRDCREQMLYGVQQGTERTLYQEPVGCAFQGNIYWQVWLINRLLGGEQVECIIRRTAAVEREHKMAYSVLLKGGPTRGEGYYCV